jgi:hypothetical protein
VARVLVLGRSFHRVARSLGEIERRALTSTVRALMDAPVLPAPGDARAMIPPTDVVHVRRVPGAKLWVWYAATDDRLLIRAVTPHPPHPLD